MIDRQLYSSINNKMGSGKAILIVGPRQTGKTTLLKKLADELPDEVLFLNADDPTIRELLRQPNTEQLKQILGTASLIIIDEAQRVSEIGITAKLIIDQFPEKQLILSGSSALELNNSMQEPLTGRKWTFELFPISWREWQNHIGYVKSEQDLENRLIFGSYPDVLNHPAQQKDILIELSDSYLYKDILSYVNIRKPDRIQQLLQALAFQLGQEVSNKELGDLTGIDSKTVDAYLNILEQAYVIFKLPAFSKNLRNEIKKNKKIYFHDNGIRNAIIRSFDPIGARNDIGALWENFLISERIKQLKYSKSKVQAYFWRTKQQQEIDYVEKDGQKIAGFEFKWNPNRKVRFSKTFVDTYGAKTQVIHRDNFRDFVMGEALG
jgi:hypothetical protein